MFRDTCCLVWMQSPNMFVSVGWNFADKLKSLEWKGGGNSGWYDATPQSWRQICHAIRIAIIHYYSKAHSLCYPTIETGNIRGNLMTHKSWCFWLKRVRVWVFNAIFPSLARNPDWPLLITADFSLFLTRWPTGDLFNVKTLE